MSDKTPKLAPELKQYYSPGDVWQLTGVSRPCIYAAIKDGKLKAILRDGRTFVARDDLLTFIYRLKHGNLGIMRQGNLREALEALRSALQRARERDAGLHRRNRHWNKGDVA